MPEQWVSNARLMREANGKINTLHTPAISANTRLTRAMNVD